MSTPAQSPEPNKQEYAKNAPISIPQQCAYVLNTNLYWAGVAIIILLSLIAAAMFTFIMNPVPYYFTGYHPEINR